MPLFGVVPLLIVPTSLLCILAIVMETKVLYYVGGVAPAELGVWSLLASLQLSKLAQNDGQKEEIQYDNDIDCASNGYHSR